MNLFQRLLITIFIFSTISCTSAKTDGYVEVSKEMKIKSSYLLIPVEEKAPEVIMYVKYEGSNEQGKYYIRLAREKADYWVKLDVSKQRDKNLTLTFDNTDKSVWGFNNLKESDIFNVEYDETYRPVFHFSPEYGWMNDPNGLVYLDGEYHLFYQYNPYGTKWGNMHWGHAVSTDLTSWTYLPVAIAPDTLGDIFSGSAVVDINNTAGFGKNAIVAVYTASGKKQQQCIAYSTDRGRTFTKYSGNPVIPNPGIADFRDPKVSWNEVAKQWIMALATKQTVTFYGSADLKNWTRLSEFGQGIGSHAGVWECPDLFPLNIDGKTKWVLLVSINPGGPNGGSATQYFIGDFDGKTFLPDNLPYPLWVDYGRDNYAGVTWSNIPQADGRRIFLGWMSNWDYANDVPSKIFRSSNTIARNLFLKNNGKHLVLASYPVKEMELLRDKTNNFSDIQTKNKAIIEELVKNNAGSYEVTFEIEPMKSENFGFSLRNSNNEMLSYHFDLHAGIVRLDRQKSGLTDFNDKFSVGMGAPLTTKNIYKIRLLVDKASAELFVNEGDITMTSLFFPTETMNGLEFFTENTSIKITTDRQKIDLAKREAI